MPYFRCFLSDAVILSEITNLFLISRYKEAKPPLKLVDLHLLMVVHRKVGSDLTALLGTHLK